MVKSQSNYKKNQDKSSARNNIDEWLQEGIINRIQHDVLVRILREESSNDLAAPETTRDTHHISRIIFSYEREREFLFRELIKARQKLNWNRAALEETRKLLQMALSLAKRSNWLSSRIMR